MYVFITSQGLWGFPLFCHYHDAIRFCLEMHDVEIFTDYRLFACSYLPIQIPISIYVISVVASRATHF